MWAPKLRTPGMAEISLLTAVVVPLGLGGRGARHGDPVHEEVAFLEGREELWPSPGDEDEPEDRHGRDDRRRRAAGR